jgi:NTP pyrophosphatase (non-canonical NTP hydrolase)
MHLSSYQLEVQKTDKTANHADPHVRRTVPFLGLVGEAGELLSEYKKELRDPGYKLSPERVAEELGDLLWYVATIANRYKLSLEGIARENLGKTRARFLRTKQLRLLPEDQKVLEPLPTRFTIEFRPLRRSDHGKARVGIYRDGTRVGAALTDNARADDGYRFHDIFHLAHAALLGWSPVTRKLLRAKRKADPEIDEVEDGGRAMVIEEGIVALAYAHAVDNSYFAATNTLDTSLLRSIRHVTRHLEVRARNEADWEHAIVTGYAVWRQLREHNGGIVHVDSAKRTLSFEPILKRSQKPGVRRAVPRATSKRNPSLRRAEPRSAARMARRAK